MNTLTDRQQLDALWGALGNSHWVDAGSGLRDNKYHVRLFHSGDILQVDGPFAEHYADTREACIEWLLAYQVAKRLDA